MEFFTLCLVFPVVLALAYVAANLAVPDGPPLHGVYAVPGRWYTLKYLVTRWLLRWSKGRKQTIRKRTMDYHMLQDKMRDISEIEFYKGTAKGQNCLYFYGSDQGGATRLAVRVSVLPNDRQELCFVLRLPGVGDLVLQNLPDCIADNVRPGDGFGGAGLKCMPIEPLRTWRIAFNGLCRVGIRSEWSADDQRPLVHLRCSLLWSTYTTFYDLTCDTNLGLAADAIAREKWTQQFVSNIQKAQHVHYVQFGMIHGVVQVGDQEERSLLMRGVKERLIGGKQLDDTHTQISNYIVLENGKCLYARASCIPGYLSNASSGFMVSAVGDVISASSVDIPLAVLLENANEIPKKFSFSLQPETGERLDVQVSIEDTMVCNTGSDWCVRLAEGMSRFTVNGVQGWGVCQTITRSDMGSMVPAKPAIPKLYREPDVSTLMNSKPLVVPLTAKLCQVTSLTGGKGSQLAKLVALQNQLPVEYQVPPGFCITTAAFQTHLQDNKDLRTVLKELREVSCTVQEGDLIATCKSTAAQIGSTPISDGLKAEIARLVAEVFGAAEGSKMYAVRSSAVGEDTSLTSAAGQMETLLGIQGMERIFEAVRKCWASNYSFQAVQYRRQYGQPLDSAMAVVVQEIVPSESAGVAFSRDPMTGDPTKIVINANYGLGESVVSGMAEADTITLRVDGKKNLTIADKKIGRKEEAISVADEGGTQTIHQTDAKAASCSVSDELCLKLGRTALLLDECFSDARDIEWAVVGGTLYLLQARAITTFDVPSRYELLHEFDTGLAVDNTWMSTANIQEMCPGAVTPLTINNFFLDCDVLDQISGVMLQRPISLPAMRNCLVGYNHPFISLTNLVGMFVKMSPLRNERLGGMLFGSAFDVDCVREGKQMNEPLPPIWRMHLNRLRFVLKAFWNRAKLEREFTRVVTHLTRRWDTAQEQYDDICRYPNDRSEILEYHAMETHKSAIMQQVVGSMISSYTDKELLPTHIALLLSSCPDVESANVPLSMEKVAKAILKEGKGQSFQSMTPADALEWLRSPSSGEAGRAFTDFLRRHGHRCVREVELRDKSWSMEPTQVIPSLQAILASGSHCTSEKKRVRSAAEAVDDLGLAIPALHRKILVSYLVPKAREGVSAREASKSKYIKINHHLKEAYWRLANLMVREGRLPDEDLLFFFTFEELGRLLRDRSPALISRALRRRRLLPEMNEMRFKLVLTGQPTPILEEEDVRAVFKLEGTPISQGIVKSKARVVTRFEDANTIQKGDILIVPITDIGWSPYFPLISGLVTEIGGVLSHGAVVAREYGIPCVVNVQRATSVFKSDDVIVMNGAAGTVEKIGTPENSEAPPASSSE